MKVLFIKDVGGVGRKDTVKDISDGYALNFLIPQGLAVQATKEKIAEMEKRQKHDKESRDERNQKLIAQLKTLSGKKIVIRAKANKEGHLFKGVKREDVAERLSQECACFIDPMMILDLLGPIKDVGEYMVHVSAAGADLAFKLAVEGE